MARQDDARYEGEMEEMIFEPEPAVGQKAPAEDKHVRVDLIIRTLKQVHESIGHIIDLFESDGVVDDGQMMAELVTAKKQLAQKLEDFSGARVVEGMFDGALMIGQDGKSYSVPPNYASKSRLVEGDVMKLTIRPDGSFVFKQIGPIERKRIVGTVAFDASTNSYVAISDGATFKVLTASVTYFKGQPGDEVVLLVPKSGKSVWAAVENVIKK
ncbi:hypothetical protein KJ611_00230 [Patescibacteria group bacterium]|nr:hypothetical protein [Patescibacteria group bacterium]MBU1705668.1 hypothetical protein [Patescibacteria group bacterium]